MGGMWGGVWCENGDNCTWKTMKKNKNNKKSSLYKREKKREFFSYFSGKESHHKGKKIVHDKVSQQCSTNFWNKKYITTSFMHDLVACSSGIQNYFHINTLIC